MKNDRVSQAELELVKGGTTKLVPEPEPILGTRNIKQPEIKEPVFYTQAIGENGNPPHIYF